MTQQNNLRSINDPRFTAADGITDNKAAPPAGGGNSEVSRGAAKARAEKALPTDRLKFANQEQVLIEVAHLSGNSRRGCSAEEMSAALGLKGGTGGLNSRFFRSANWFELVGRGAYTASRGLLDYAQHINIDPDDRHTAATAMREEVKTSWFWEALEGVLESGRPVSLKTVLLVLAKEAGASDHTPQLETIIDWLVWVGLVKKDGSMVSLVEGAAPIARPNYEVETEGVVEADDSAQIVDEVEQRQVEQRQVEHDRAAEPARPASVEDSAIVSFNMSVRLTAEDMQSLDENQRQFLLDFASKLRG